MTSQQEESTEHLREELAACRRRVAELEEMLLQEGARSPHQDMLETLLEHMPDYVYFKDEKRRFVLASRLFCGLFGRSLEEILGKTDEELFPPEVAEQTSRDDEHVIRTGTPIVCKEEGSDELGWVLTTKVPWRDRHGHIVGLLGMSRDVTARKRAESERRKADEHYRQLVENSPTVLWMTDSTGATSYISPNVEPIYGYSSRAIQEGGEALWFGRIHPDDVARVREAFEALFDGEKPFDVEYRIKRRDGHWIWLHDRANAVVAEQGRLRAHGVFTDVTERKRSEAERRELEARLHQHQRLESLGVLASGLAHDFNNLLVAIYGNIDLVALGLEPGSPASHHIAEARAAARRAAELIGQILVYAGKGSMRHEDLELGQLVRDMAALLRTAIPKSTTVRFDLESAPLVTRGDSTQIGQIVMNLITNAAQAIGDEVGEISLTVKRVTCDRAFLREIRPDEELPVGEYLCLEVSDTGGGMDAQVRDQIFDPFFTTKSAGSGLGLSAAHGIVRRHRGAIQVDSEPGKGTTFRVWLPAAPASTPKLTGDVVSDWRGQGTILIVDDDESVRSFAAASARHLGFETLTASDGRDGVDLFQKHADEIVCVLLDLRMPRMGGEDALTELGRLSCGVPVILCSGFADEVLAERLSHKGVAGLLHKPYSVATLQRELQRCLASTPAGR